MVVMVPPTMFPVNVAAAAVTVPPALRLPLALMVVARSELLKMALPPVTVSLALILLIRPESPRSPVTSAPGRV